MLFVAIDSEFWLGAGALRHLVAHFAKPTASFPHASEPVA